MVEQPKNRAETTNGDYYIATNKNKRQTWGSSFQSTGSHASRSTSVSKLSSTKVLETTKKLF